MKKGTTLGLLIKTWRESLGMSQREFADFVCVSKNSIHNYETGKLLPNMASLMLITDKLGVSLQEFLFIDIEE